MAATRDPVIPTVPSPANSFADTPLYPHERENCFTDAYGRTIILRGLNVGGCSKVPSVTRTKRRIPTGKEVDEETVSYSGRPFKSVEEAVEWWRRLRMWGVGVIRWVITWEAVEPKEMGKYDEEYIEYVVAVLQKAGEAGLKVFVDVHQDCWSRFSGGSGAPAWTFTKAGIDPSTFHSTYTAALLPPHPLTVTESTLVAPYIFSEHHLPSHQTGLSLPSSHLWATNYTKFSCATMFTLFWAGSTFAPKATVKTEGVERNVGDVLQEAYINAFKYVAKRLAHLDCILGWDAMNEPHPGYVGTPSLKKWNQNTELHLGVMPNAVQGMVLASGGDDNPEPPNLKLPIYHRSWPGPSSTTTNVNYSLKDGARVWTAPGKDIWRNEGVWWWDQKSKDGYAFKNNYFTKDPKTGKKIEFERDFYEPFLRRFLAAVAEGRDAGLRKLGLLSHAGAGKWSFIEPVPNGGPPTWIEDDSRAPYRATTGGGSGVCYAPHWYDLRACFEKQLSYTLSFDVGALALGSRNFYLHSYFGRFGLLGNYTSQFARLVSRLKVFRKSGLPTPVLVGETGIPFDINDFEAYKTGDVHWQLVMLDSVTGAMERVAKGTLNWTLWNFTSENYVTATGEGAALSGANKEIESGDGWNSEDFSLVSRDHAMTEVPYPGGKQSLRPHPAPEPNNLGTPLTRAHKFEDLYIGARCTGAWIRPYATKIAGVVVSSAFTLGNIDNGNRECWGGRWAMKYHTSTPHEGAPEITRTTEIFLPAYHFGGEVWSLNINLTRSPAGVTSRTTFLITESNISGMTSLPTKTGGAAEELIWRYNEALQTLVLIHSPTLSGVLVEVSAEVGVEEDQTAVGRALVYGQDDRASEDGGVWGLEEGEVVGVIYEGSKI
ncbi:hypothetical protein DFH27DRAFT_594912 [Peziza echinospora]|nr:hypothetical protein DFH27DRAFT_594912 [Peziza echinospora]